MKKNNISELLKKVKDICRDNRFEKLNLQWEKMHRGELTQKIPVKISMNPVWWTTALGYRFKDLVVNVKPEVAIEFQLRQKMFLYQNVPDDTVITPDIFTIPTWTPTITPFGAKYAFDFRSSSWHLPPALKEKKDLDKLSPWGGDKETYTKEKNRTLDRFNELVKGEIPVHYLHPPEQAMRGPFSVACDFYGYTNVLISLAEDRDFLRRLMDFVTQSRLKYEEGKAEAIGMPTEKSFCQLSEDEVDGNVVSPKTYQELIFPYESKISRIFKEVLYHSCGNLTPFLPFIAKLPNLHIQHISPWTDLKIAVEQLPPNIILEKHLLITKDVFQASPEDMEIQIKKIFSLTRNRPAYICISGIMEGSLTKPLQWLASARKYLRR